MLLSSYEDVFYLVGCYGGLFQNMSVVSIFKQKVGKNREIMAFCKQPMLFHLCFRQDYNIQW